MTTVVISQPMFLPWRGLFEQIRLADVYIHLMDVPLPQGRSMMNRVQIKTPAGNPWLTAPLAHGSGPLIDAVQFAPEDRTWRKKHLATLAQWYQKAPHFETMMALAQSLYDHPTESLAEFNRHAIETLSAFYGLAPRFMDSRTLTAPGKGSEKMLQLVQAVSGTNYVTGHGAKNYLDHEAFETHGIEVSYMDYQGIPYPQLHGEFIPYVTLLDLVANTGKDGRDTITSGTVPWQSIRPHPNHASASESR